MATGTQPPWFPQQFWDYTGVSPILAAGYKLYQYVQGTTTDQVTFTNKALTVQNTQPITLNATGKCQFWMDPALLYTFVLKTPGGATVDTWDVTPTPLPTSGSFLPLTGGTMTGLITLSGDATSPLNPVTKQQLDSGLASALSSVTSVTDAATAAAAAATAAAAAIKQGVYMIASASGGAASFDVVNPALGTYLVLLATSCRHPTPTASFTITATQSGSFGTTNLSTSIPLTKMASDTQTSTGFQIATGTLVISAAGTYTLSMSAGVFGALTGTGSFMMAVKQ